jgi:hypothetical protein
MTVDSRRRMKTGFETVSAYGFIACSSLAVVPSSLSTSSCSEVSYGRR